MFFHTWRSLQNSPLTAAKETFPKYPFSFICLKGFVFLHFRGILACLTGICVLTEFLFCSRHSCSHIHSPSFWTARTLAHLFPHEHLAVPQHSPCSFFWKSRFFRPECPAGSQLYTSLFISKPASLWMPSAGFPASYPVLYACNNIKDSIFHMSVFPSVNS